MNNAAAADIAPGDIIVRTIGGGTVRLEVIDTEVRGWDEVIITVRYANGATGTEIINAAAVITID